MAEQDKADLVPSVLNDLIDVDGEPAEGDGLVRSAGAWRPGPGGGTLPEFGPAISIWEAYYTGANLANKAAVDAAWQNLVMERGLGGYYATYPGVQPTLGAWTGEATGIKRFTFDGPGHYSVYLHQGMGVSAYNAAGTRFASMPLNALHWWIWGTTDPVLSPGAAGISSLRTDRIELHISQGMIDAGFGSFIVDPPIYNPAGAERVNALALFAFIERHSPGSTFDYYGDL